MDKNTTVEYEMRIDSVVSHKFKCARDGNVKVAVFREILDNHLKSLSRGENSINIKLVSCDTGRELNFELVINVSAYSWEKEEL